MHKSFRQRLIRISIGLTLLFELITIAARVIGGRSAAEYVQQTQPPLLLQMHHMFWAVPLLVLAVLLRRFETVALILWGLSLGLIFSDLLHHFLVLPLWVGNTGWHWP